MVFGLAWFFHGLAHGGEKIQFSGSSSPASSTNALPWKQKQLFPSIDLQNTVGGRNPGAEAFSVPPPYSAPGTALNKNQIEELDKQRNWIFVAPEKSASSSLAREPKPRSERETGFNSPKPGVLEKFLAGPDKTSANKQNSQTNDVSTADELDTKKKSSLNNSTVLANSTLNPATLRNGESTNGMSSATLSAIQRSLASQAGANGSRDSDANRIDAAKLLGITSSDNSNDTGFRSGMMDKLINPSGSSRVTAHDLVVSPLDPARTIGKNGSAPDLNNLPASSRSSLDLSSIHKGAGDFGKNNTFNNTSAGINPVDSTPPPPVATPLRRPYQPAVLEIPKRKF